MENHEDVYEPPMLTEAGDFNEVTLGLPFGDVYDGGLPPFWRYPRGA